MVQLSTMFDAEAIEPNSSYEPIPPGDYPAQIINSEWRDTKSGSGRYIWMEIEITDGQYRGRKLFERLNIENSNPTAVDIAFRTMSSISRACGVLKLKETEQLYFKEFTISLKVRPAGPDKNGIDRDAQNEIKGYKSLRGSAPAASAPSAPAASSAPPWRRS